MNREGGRADIINLISILHVSNVKIDTSLVQLVTDAVFCLAHAVRCEKDRQCTVN